MKLQIVLEKTKMFWEKTLKPELSFRISRQIVSSSKGMALMMAVFTVTLLMIIAMEIVYESSIEFLISSQGVNQIKAYYAAKSGVELSRLRIHLYKKAVAGIGSALPDKSMLDPIWQLPFAWPPLVPPEVSGIDKDAIKAAVKKSAMKAQYSVSIESEGSRIDINDLGSPSKVLAKNVRDQLQQIYDNQIEADDEFGKKYRNYDFTKLFNNIADWVTDGSESLNGGDKKNAYPDVHQDTIPPKQPFKSIQELHMVALMTDELYDVLAPHITVFGAKGININYASKEVLKSLSPQITDERADKVVEARGKPERGPFRDLKDFVDYLDSLGVSGNPFVDKNNVPTMPLTFDTEYNFRIKSTGISGPVRREIVAIIYDFDRAKQALATQLQAEKQAAPTPTPAPGTNPPPVAAAPTPTPTPGANNSNKMPTDAPIIVYWDEG
jgi:general secretion pathway protein K